MILTKDLLDDLLNLENNIHSLTLVQNPNNLQIESFLRNLEKRRYSILNQIKLYNKTVTYGTQKLQLLVMNIMRSLKIIYLKFIYQKLCHLIKI